MVNAGLFVLITLIWGTTWYAIEFQLGVVPQSWSVAYRFGGSALLLFLLSLARGHDLRYPRRLHGLFFAIGACIFSLNYLQVYWGTAYLPSGLVALAFSALSLFNLINGRLWLKQRFTWPMLIGAVIGSTGLGLVFWPEIAGAALSSQALVGLVLVLGAAFTASAGNTMLARKAVHALPGLAVNAWSMAYGAGLMALIALIFDGAPVLDTRPAYLWSFLYLVIWGTVLSFTIYLALIQRIGLGPAGYVAVIMPLVALSVSTLFEGYRWSGPALAGVGLILLGNILIRHRPASSRWPRRVTS